jgi:hypothetical protein
MDVFAKWNKHTHVSSCRGPLGALPPQQWALQLLVSLPCCVAERQLGTMRWSAAYIAARHVVPALQLSSLTPRCPLSVYIWSFVTFACWFIGAFISLFSLFIYFFPFSFCLFNSFFVSPDVAVKWMPLRLRIREVPGSNLGPETGSSG